jgi:hypothetical protein
MKIRDRYITKTLFTYTLVVLVVWLSIYSFFNFLAELNSVGDGGYTILSAFKYIVLQLPEVAYNQASPVILLGCILGMGHLATTSQLLIFRASGASILKISITTLKNTCWAKKLPTFAITRREPGISIKIDNIYNIYLLFIYLFKYLFIYLFIYYYYYYAWTSRRTSQLVVSASPYGF